jgi:two-component system sensor kinase FixL
MTQAYHQQAMTLKESQRFLNSVTNNLPGMLYRCRNNRNCTMEYVSGSAESLTGYTPDELIFDKALTYASLVVDEDRERVWEEVQTALKVNQLYKTIYRIKTKQGKQKWVWEQGCMVCSAEDDSDALEGIIIDITEQKQVEEALQESKERIRGIIDGSIEGICVHRDWRPLFVNQTLADILGYDSPAEILAMSSNAEFIAPHERDRILKYLHAREAGRAAPKRYEFEALRQDGTTVFLENIVTRVDWGGQPAILATLIDITKHKRAEEEAKQLRMQLGHIDRLNTLGEMAAGIAHEINQPLTAILSRCGAARRRIDNNDLDMTKILSALEVIEQQAQRTGEVIQRVRELAKQKNDHREIINISTLVQQCIEFAEMDGQVNDISTTVDFGPDLPAIIGDPVQIQQVMLNLIRNASDAMEQMPVEDRYLTVSVRDHVGSAVQVAISDCGSGLSEATEGKLYQSFFTTKASGMGMGLSICRSIVTAHGGRFWFTRNPERGVTFQFTLPIACGAEHD